MSKYIFNSLILITLIITNQNLQGQNKDYTEEWKNVQSMENKGLPRSALDIVDRIHKEAWQENNAPQFLKAALYQIKLRADYQEDFMESSLMQLDSEIAIAKSPIRQILNSIQAELFQRYYDANRYKLLDRSIITEADPKDIKTWDVNTLTDHIIKGYLASLQDAGSLQKIPIDSFDPILVKASGSEVFRPTLYDFLAYRAADYFMNDEAGLIRPAESFELDKPAYIGPAAEFVKLKMQTKDTFALKFYALEIYRDLLVFHQDDKEPDAFIDADLHRLEFVRNNAVFEDKDSLYLNSLTDLQKRFASSPASAGVTYKIAREYMKLGAQYDPYNAPEHRWALKKALELSNAAIKLYPGSAGAKNCRTLLPQITSVSLDLTTYYANVPGENIPAYLSFKNIDKVYFRIISIDPASDKEIRESGRNEDKVARYLTFSPLKEWTRDIPDTGDFQNHSTQISLPALPLGYYVILAGTDKNFSTDNKPVAFTSFWVTNISFISKKNEEGALGLYVIDREAGSPIDKVEVQSYRRDYDYNSRSYIIKKLDKYTSDKEGYVDIPSPAAGSKSFYLGFKKGNDQFITENYFYLSPPRKEEKTSIVTYFFTDRSIYRPGQTIYFKGIMLEKTGDKYAIKPGFNSVVSFYDVNNQKISSLPLVTNDYGSFNGSFTAPTGTLTGQMHIENGTGSTTFSVEEYKRPKFEVGIDPLQGDYKLSELVSVSGFAKAYAGNPVDNAEVKYRVVRTARFPIWRFWWTFFPSSPQMEITNGVTSTDSEGKFKLSFMAIPDKLTSKKYDPLFDYTVYADVTDINGETHSAEQTVSIGYTALLADVDIPERLDRNDKSKFTLTTTNLNGQRVNAKGTINIVALQSPGQVLRKREWARPDVFVMTEAEFRKDFPHDIYNNEDDPETWPQASVKLEQDFDTGKDTVLNIAGMDSWEPGTYRLEISTKDAFGQKVDVKKYFILYSPENKKVPDNGPDWFEVPKTTAEVGETVDILAGSAEKNVMMLYEVMNKGELISREWVKLSNEQKKFEIPVKEEYRGDFSVNLAFIRGNRSYSHQQLFKVPYTNKELNIRFETFRDKLLPGQEEEWRIHIAAKNGDKVAAEMLASMYDASLDALKPHDWSFNLWKLAAAEPGWSAVNAFNTVNTRVAMKRSSHDFTPVIQSYDHLNWFGFYYYGGRLSRGVMMKNMDVMEMQAAPGQQIQAVSELNVVDNRLADKEGRPALPPKPPKATEQGEVPIRTNFNETAFFFPTLQTDENGDVIIKFKVPESLTRWKMMGLAYTKDLMTGMITKELVTQKDLMVMPNPPRFFREGDVIYYSAKVVSMSDKDMDGTVKAEFFDAYTMKPIDDLLGNTSGEKIFNIAKGKSQAFSWQIKIPTGIEAIVCRVSARSGQFTDGEEQPIPVLPNRMLVTESLPLWINGIGTKEFRFEKLLNSGKSKTLSNYNLALEFTSNPAWYAVQALPYLMEYPNECSEQLFSRYYANSLATYIANSNPKIKRVFDSWKNITPDALLSNLEKNQEFKAVVLEETPWVLQAQNETERKQRIGLLFDLNKMSNDMDAAMRKLQKQQGPGGGWPWFEGMKESTYITQLIVAGMGRLQKMGVIDLREQPSVLEMVRKAVSFMDMELKDDYDRILQYDKDKKDDNHLSQIQIQYLYARSFFVGKIEPNKACTAAIDYFTGQADKYWLQQNNYLQGMIAVALNRGGNLATAGEIIKSLEEHALYSDEMGMYWRNDAGYFWFQSPVETQSMMMEAFSEVAGDQASVEKMKIWLLKQKQTQDWKTTRATADAIYALLLNGTDMLASDVPVQVTMGYEKVDPLKMEGTEIEAGTGYFQVNWKGNEIQPEMGDIKVTKSDKGIAWGAVYWQYYEDLDKITAAKTPLNIEKELYLEKNTPAGPVLDKITESTALKVGDKVKVRIVIRVDRDMEYVHMKDMRGATFEPVNVLSGYRYQGGLGYYEATRDASVNFFFNYLNKGTYVFEYPLVVSQKGDFSNGISTIQCMYAPEFSAHSQGIRVKVE